MSIFNGGVIGIGARAVARSGDIDITRAVHGNGLCIIPFVTRPIIPFYPELFAVWAVLDGGIVATGARTRALSGDIDIAQAVHGNGACLIIVLSRPVVFLDPELFAVYVVLDGGKVAIAISGDIDIARAVHGNGCCPIRALSRPVVSLDPELLGLYLMVA